MKRLMVFSAVAFATAFAAQALTYEVKMSRADGVYAAGDSVPLTVTALVTNGVKAASGVLTVTLDNFGSKTYATRKVDLAKENPFTVTATRSDPGIVRMRLQAKGEKDWNWGVAFSPERIRTGCPRPADFDRFWADAKAKYDREVPVDVKLERLEKLSRPGINAYRLSLTTPHGRTVDGILCEPADLAKGPFPVRISVPGAGPSSGTAGGSADRISLTMNVHYYPLVVGHHKHSPGNDELIAREKAEIADCQAKYRVNRYCYAGIAVSREEYHYYDCILAVSRALDWLWARPEVRKDDFRCSGTSQGGGFTLILSGFNAHITRAAAYVPAMTDLLGSLDDGRMSGWPRLVECHPEDLRAAATRNAPYFDAAHFAANIRIPIRVVVGLSDTVCPPAAVWSGYNAIPSKDKAIVPNPGMTHSVFRPVYAEVGKWFESADAAPRGDVEAREDALSQGVVILPGNGKAKIALDRASAAYRCGEEAVFTVTVLGEDGAKTVKGEVSWTLDNYGAQVFSRGTADLAKGNPFTVKGTMPYPGFLRVSVKVPGERNPARYSAAFDQERIRTAVPKPADFDRFWDEAVARLEKEVPLDARVEQVPGWPKNGINMQRVSFATVGGRRVHGVLVTPEKPRDRPVPVHVHFPGAGAGLALSHCHGDPGHVVLFMNAHYFPVPDTPEAAKVPYEAQEAMWRKIHGPNSARAYPVGGLTLSPEKAHYYGIILGVNRAIDWVAKRPDIDRRHFTYSGASQGGGFGLILTALNRNITRAFAGVPAMTDVMGCKANGRQSGWPRILEYETQKDSARLAAIERNAPYFDAAYFAERITVPICLSVGYIDESCAPHAVMSAYNAIPSKDKKIYHGVGGHHGSRNAPMDVVNKWLEE